MDLTAAFLRMDMQTWVALAAGSVVTIMVAFLIYQIQKSPRTLDYAIRSTQDLTANASPHLRDRMSIIWRDVTSGGFAAGRTLKEPRIVNYHIRNTGKRAIDADDFKSPIEVKAGTGSIVDIIVTKVSHDGILDVGPLPSEHGTSSFTPALMNPKDWIELQVITNGCPEPPELSSWIREETRPMEKRQGLLDPPVREVVRRLSQQSSYNFWMIWSAVTAGLASVIAFLSAIFKWGQ
jgi:hypothetical protein